MSAELQPLFGWRSQLVEPDSGLTATERHVALTLALHMNERGGSCFPSIRTLAREVRELVDEGQTVAALRAGMERMVERQVMQPRLLGNFVAEAAVKGRAPNKKYGRRAVSAREVREFGNRLRDQAREAKAL